MKLWQEMIHVGGIEAAVLFQPGSGQALLAFVLERNRAVGIVKNAKHNQFVKMNLGQAVKTLGLAPSGARGVGELSYSWRRPASSQCQGRAAFTRVTSLHRHDTHAWGPGHGPGVYGAHVSVARGPGRAAFAGVTSGARGSHFLWQRLAARLGGEGLCFGTVLWQGMSCWRSAT